MKTKIGRRGGIGLMIGVGMIMAAAGPVHAAVRTMRHVVHSRGYTSLHRHDRTSRVKARSSSRRISSRRTYSGHREIVQQSPMPNRIEEIQTAMAQQGAYQGEPSGKWDGATSDALRSYQERSGLPPTGKLDAASLQHLGLGSDVAGLNPPKAVLPAAATAGNAKGPAK